MRPVELAVVFLLIVPASAAAEPGASDRQALRHLVLQDCGSCHGMTLKGGLGGPLLPGALEGKDADALAEVILHGIEGTPMPGWKGLLSPSEARWIAAELKKGSFVE
ncbi:MAG: cytochrome c [Rhodovibrionaceae bacterium]|nr:cytochrome c [Rhodovibrionaceae bacterium]